MRTSEVMSVYEPTFVYTDAMVNDMLLKMMTPTYTRSSFSMKH